MSQNHWPCNHLQNQYEKLLLSYLMDLRILDNLKIFEGSFAESFRENWPMKRIPAPARSLPTLRSFFSGIPKPRNDGPIEAEAEPNPSDLGSGNFWKRDVHGSNKATGSTVLCVFLEIGGMFQQLEEDISRL